MAACSSASVECTETPQHATNEPVEITVETEEGSKGRKRQRKKQVKRLGLRKNTPAVAISSHMDCCKKKCLQNFNTECLTQARSNFLDLSYDQQNIYLDGLLQRRQTKKSSGHQRKAVPATSSSGRRISRPPAEESSFSFQYTLRNDRGINVHVCQKAFCIVHGFGPKRLQVLRRKVLTGQLELDRRGKHGNHATVGEEVKERIREHIRSLPARRSHYSRKDNSNRLYLTADLSIARLHHDFLEKNDPEYILLVEENRRRAIAHERTEVLRKPLVSEHLYLDI